MRVLVLGGSWFVGRVIVDEAVRRGHDVTVFNRGRSASPFPAPVTHLRGDRESTEDVRALARRGSWDVLVDVAGSVPAVVRRSCVALRDAVDRCVIVSTISAYREWPHAPVDERSPLWDGDPDLEPGTRRWDPDAYGPLKVGCEIACRQEFGDERLLVLRPHVVLGPYEYVGRLPWWLSRMRRGGRVLAPAPDRGIQPVDARDLAEFLLDQAELDRAGVFNVAPRPGASTFADLLHACVAATAGEASQPASLVWADEDWLVEQDVTQWTELPLWRNAAAPWSMDTELAHAAGLRCRPLGDTVADTWAWLRSGGRAVDHERFAEHGIEPEREAALIEGWLARSSSLARPPGASRTPG
jgi:nucleoside-diphosphate-sugar epimerase